MRLVSLLRCASDRVGPNSMNLGRHFILAWDNTLATN